MQPDGAYQLIEALGSSQVGTVWSAVDTLGRSLTVAVLDPAAAADPGWRDAFAATAHVLSAEPNGLRVLTADFSASAPWVACLVDDGPGAEQIFIALGMEYYPAPSMGDPGATMAGGWADSPGQPDAPAAGAEEQVLHEPAVGLEPVPSSPAQPAVFPPPSSEFAATQEPSPTEPHSVSGPPEAVSGMPQAVSGPPQSVSGPPEMVSGPPQSVSGPPEAVSGVPQAVSGPPQMVSGPPEAVSGVPQAVSGPPQTPVAGPQPPTFDPPPPANDPSHWTGWPSQPVGNVPEISYTYQSYPPAESTVSAAPRRRTGLWIGIAVALVVALAAAGGIYAWRSDGGTPVAASSGTPVASASPTPKDNRPAGHNTGVPKDADLRVVEGDRTFAKDGQVYSGLDLHGNVRITGDNVTLRRSIIRGVGKVNGDKCTTTPVIWIDGGKNVTIQDVEVYGAEPNACLDGIWAENASLSRLNIHHVVDGVKAHDNVVVQLSYIHDLTRFASSPTQDGGPTHNDGVQSWEGNHDITLRRNTIKLTPQDNAAFQVNQSNRTRATDIYVKDNWLDGGWCTLNFSQGNGPTPMTGIYVSNNRFGPTSSCPIHLSPAVTLSANERNVWDDTNEPIPPPQRPSR
jgi:hypothetical protein